MAHFITNYHRENQPPYDNLFYELCEDAAFSLRGSPAHRRTVLILQLQMQRWRGADRELQSVAVDDAIKVFSDCAFFYLLACDLSKDQVLTLVHARDGLLCQDTSLHIRRRLLCHAAEKGLAVSLRLYATSYFSEQPYSSRCGQMFAHQAFIDVQEFIDLLEPGSGHAMIAIRTRAILRLLLEGPYITSLDYHVSPITPTGNGNTLTRHIARDSLLGQNPHFYPRRIAHLQ